MRLDNINIEVITSGDQWGKTLDAIGVYDFYHTYEYHIIEQTEDAYPVLLKYSKGNTCIAMPFLIRKIANSDYFDATSVYGYSGPISRNINSNFDNTFFIEKLRLFFEDNNIISVFTRLNPYIDNQKILLKNYGDIINHGKVVNIDLKLNVNIQKRNYQERLRTYINKSRRNCIVKKLESKEELKEFIDIYHNNMRRLNADEYFYFDEDYFTALLNSDQFDAEILLVIDIRSGETVAGSLFVTTNNIVQYHLSGTRFEFSHLTPTKLLIDEMRIEATERGLQFYNLGGGIGGNSKDSLFRFKSSFSKDFKDFNTWNLIVNQTVYNDLVKKQGKIETSFFPEYRSNVNNLVARAD